MDAKQRDFVGKTLQDVMDEAKRVPRKTLELKYACAEVNQALVFKLHNDFIKKIRAITDSDHNDASVMVLDIVALLPMKDDPPENPKVSLDVVQDEEDNC